MILWINGAFGSGKTTVAFELHRRIKNSCVYDPENAGYFMWKNSSNILKKGDFQDFELWREINYKMLKLISENYDGIIIAPMTLVNPEYYKEIIGRLRDDGLEVRHFILYASKETIIKNLKARGLGRLKRESFAVQSIDRCIYSFDNYIKEEKIIADNKSPDKIVSEIAAKTGLELEPDKRSGLKKFFDRYFTLIKHIRI
jgi:broad-specificity NMP kinase